MISPGSVHRRRPRLLGFLSTCALVLLLSGCGNHGRPVILVTPDTEASAGEPPKNSVTASPVDPETIEEERVLTSAPQEIPDEEMSREDFLKVIEKAKKSAPPLVVPAAHPADPKPEVEKKIPAQEEPTQPASKPESDKLPTDVKKPVQEEETPPAKTVETKPEEPAAPEAPTQAEAQPETPPVTENDIGIDSEDETAAEAYTGPKSVVARPLSTDEFNLSETAARLGAMDPAQYRQLQKNVIGTSARACNFFLVTALVEAKIADENHLPIYQAALFDTKYFEPKGWKKITVATLKEWFKAGKIFDVALQRNAPAGKKHGHVAIPVGLNEKGQILVADGVYMTVSNRIRMYSDSEISSKYNLFARTPD